MRRITAPIVLLAVCAARAWGQAPSAPEIRHAVDVVYPSLVRIAVVASSFRNGREAKGEVFGSGTIISADGYVVTNHHVAGKGTRIVCTLSDRTEVPADLVGTDPMSDIAVLKLRPAAPRTFPFASFGDSASVKAGDPVLALGSPLALSQSVTLGIVSNRDMVMPVEFGTDVSLDGEDVGSVVRWIGHDAAIYPGNSGGPLVNVRGEIIGVNELSFGLSAAIPSAVVKPVAQALIAERRVRRAWIGVELQPRVSTQHGPGALVSWVEPGSPAAQAGIESGDVITAIGSHTIDVQFAEQLPLANAFIAGLTPGDAVAVDAVRAGGVRHLRVTPVERSAALAQPLELLEWGMVASDITPTMAREMARASTSGVRILSVRAGGAAQQAKAPLAEDDVIVEVDGRPIATVADLQRFTSQALSGAGQASVLVAIDREQERRLAVVRLARMHTEQPPAEARRAWLAIAFQVLEPPLAERLGLKGQTGVRVTRVIDPALPLRVGDVILAIDGNPVRASSPGDEEVFLSMLRQYRSGATPTLTVHRDGADVPVQVGVRLAPRQPRELPRHNDETFGFSVRALAESDQDDPTLQDVRSGLVVAGVEPGSWASLARLRRDDVIVAVDGEPVGDVDALAARMDRAASAHQTSVVLKVRRGVRTVFVELKPGWRGAGPG